MISNLIQIELAFINTSHPDFVGLLKFLLFSSNFSSSLFQKGGEVAIQSVMEKTLKQQQEKEAAARPAPPVTFIF
jgi:hypothetical protein